MSEILTLYMNILLSTVFPAAPAGDECIRKKSVMWAEIYALMSQWLSFVTENKIHNTLQVGFNLIARPVASSNRPGDKVS